MTNRICASDSSLEDEVRLLERLQRSGAAIAAKLDLQSLAQTVVELATELSGARSGTLFYRETGRDRGAPTRDEPDGHAQAHAGDPRGAPLPTSMVASGEILFSGNLGADPQRKQVRLPVVLPAGHPAVRSYLAVPVATSTGDVFGGIVVGHPDPDVFTEPIRRIVAGIAEQAAIAIGNAQLYEAMRHTSEERARLLDAERAARAALEKAELTKNDALASLSHQLRSPLHAILGWSEVLLGRLGPESEHRRGLEVIARNARVQAQLIGELIDKQRTAAATVPGAAEPAAVRPFVRRRPGDVGHISLAGLTILVIDDDDDARDLVKTILVHAAADVMTAAAADEGLALLRRRPDVVVSDIGMAMRDGYQFIRLVRTLSPAQGGATPAVALTALALAEDRTRALLAGFQDHLAKPVEAERLVAAIHRLASRPA